MAKGHSSGDNFRSKLLSMVSKRAKCSWDPEGTSRLWRSNSSTCSTWPFRSTWTVLIDLFGNITLRSTSAFEDSFWVSVRNSRFFSINFAQKSTRENRARGNRKTLKWLKLISKTNFRTLKLKSHKEYLIYRTYFVK